MKDKQLLMPLETRKQGQYTFWSARFLIAVNLFITEELSPKVK